MPHCQNDYCHQQNTLVLQVRLLPLHLPPIIQLFCTCNIQFICDFVQCVALCIQLTHTRKNRHRQLSLTVLFLLSIRAYSTLRLALCFRLQLLLFAVFVHDVGVVQGLKHAFAPLLDVLLTQTELFRLFLVGQSFGRFAFVCQKVDTVYLFLNHTMYLRVSCDISESLGCRNQTCNTVGKQASNHTQLAHPADN